MRFFLTSTNFSKMCTLFRYVAILLSSTQCIEGFLVTLINSIIDVKFCLKDKLRKKLKDLR